MKPPRLLGEDHAVNDFDCGVESMNHWLCHTAMRWQKSHGSRVLVLTDNNDKVTAFYSLASGSVSRNIPPKRMTRNSPDPMPVIVMGRLAVSVDRKGEGIARDLMLDAFDRVYEVSRSVGVVAIVVHALGEHLLGFYEKFGFIRSTQPGQELILFKPVRDIAKEIEAASAP